MQLRFPSFAVVNSREDCHLKDLAHCWAHINNPRITNEFSLRFVEIKDGSSKAVYFN